MNTVNGFLSPDAARVPVRQPLASMRTAAAPRDTVEVGNTAPPHKKRGRLLLAGAAVGAVAVGGAFAAHAAIAPAAAQAATPHAAQHNATAAAPASTADAAAAPASTAGVAAAPGPSNYSPAVYRASTPTAATAELTAYDPGYGGYGNGGLTPAFQQTLQDWGNFANGYPNTQGIYNANEGFINGNYSISSGNGIYGTGSPSSIYDYNQSLINQLYGISSGNPYGTSYYGAGPQSQYNYTQNYINQLYSQFGP